MNCCKKCGEALKENAKFCSRCGALVEFSDNSDILNDEMLTINKEVENTDSRIKNDLENFNEEKKSNKRNFKIISFAIISVVAIFIIGEFFFVKINSNPKEQNPSIAIVNADITNYPNVVLTIKADNYSESLKIGNFTIKEKDIFQKDLKLKKEEENNYIISYKSSDESTSGERNIKIAYLENDKESISETSYMAPEKNKNNAQTVNSNNAVNTYDKNEIDIKQAINNYENAYIRMIDSKDTYYIKDVLDLSGGLLNEFNATVKSYSEQKINENLIKHDIENIRKISDTQYEVTNYEKFNIYYGKKNESKYTDFRTTYILNKTNSGFKVYSIKKIDNLGSY